MNLKSPPITTQPIIQNAYFNRKLDPKTQLLYAEEHRRIPSTLGVHMIKALEGSHLALLGTEDDKPIHRNNLKTSSSGELSSQKPFSQLAKIWPSKQMPFSATVNGAVRLVFDSNLNMVHRLSLRDHPSEVLEIDLSKIRGMSDFRHSAVARARVIVDVLPNLSGEGFMLKAKIDVANDGDQRQAGQYNEECNSFSRYRVDTSSRTSRSIRDPHLNFILSNKQKIRQLTISPPSTPSDDDDMAITSYRIEQPSADDYLLRYTQHYDLKKVDERMNDKHSPPTPAYASLEITSQRPDETFI